MKTKKPNRRRPERLAILHPEFGDDLAHWVASDRAIAQRILQLGDQVLRDPCEGIGKPEPLRFYMQGCWSRRVTQEHRLVYLAHDDRIDILMARYHY